MAEERGRDRSGIWKWEKSLGKITLTRKSSTPTWAEGFFRKKISQVCLRFGLIFSSNNRSKKSVLKSIFRPLLFCPKYSLISHFKSVNAPPSLKNEVFLFQSHVPSVLLLLPRIHPRALQQRPLVLIREILLLLRRDFPLRGGRPGGLERTQLEVEV